MLAEKHAIEYIDRTYDTELVRSILSDSELLKRAGGLPVETYDPANQQDIIYLIPKIDDNPIGVTVLHYFSSPICFQIHVNYKPEFWGHKLNRFSDMALQWVWENTDIEKVIAFAPDCYPEVKKHAERSGMVAEGLLTNATKHNGKLIDQHIMGVSKWQQQQ
jgi:RimJ/RimL family protein N-acetyltransferase